MEKKNGFQMSRLMSVIAYNYSSVVTVKYKSTFGIYICDAGLNGTKMPKIHFLYADST